MKQRVCVVIFTALTLGLVQSMHPVKQKVFASKVGNPAREVEVKIIGWNQGQPISSSKFKKNTTGLFTNALYFDFDRGYQKDGNLWNKIQAQYTDGQGPEFETLEVVSAPKDAKIKLESSKIRLVGKNGQDVSQVLSKPETLDATITQIPTGQLLIISGDYTLDKNKVGSQAAKAHGVLDSVEYNDGQGGPIKIFKDRLTKIYVKKPSGDSVITGLHALDIKKSGDKPILIIEEDGRARLSHMPAWKTVGKKASVAKAEDQALEAERNATSKLEDYIKTGQLSMSVALKALLTSTTKADYISKADRLVSNQDFVKNLMNQKLQTDLRYTPFAYNAEMESPSHIPAIRKQKQQKLVGLQPLYTELYDVLCKNASMDAGAKQKIQKLYSAMYSL